MRKFGSSDFQFPKKSETKIEYQNRKEAGLSSEQRSKGEKNDPF